MFISCWLSKKFSCRYEDLLCYLNLDLLVGIPDPKRSVLYVYWGPLLKYDVLLVLVPILSCHSFYPYLSNSLSHFQKGICGALAAQEPPVNMSAYERDQQIKIAPIVMPKNNNTRF
jgi:hypothetical protein